MGGLGFYKAPILGLEGVGRLSYGKRGERGGGGGEGQGAFPWGGVVRARGLREERPRGLCLLRRGGVGARVRMVGERGGARGGGGDVVRIHGGWRRRCVGGIGGG